MGDAAKPAAPAGALRLEDLSDSQILAMIEQAATDPFTAKVLLALRKQAAVKMADTVQRTLAKLNGIGAAQERSAPPRPISVLALAAAARQREAAGKKKREFAEYLVIGALTNRDNPDWDIFDPATPAAPAQPNGMLALLKMTAAAPAKPAR